MVIVILYFIKKERGEKLLFTLIKYLIPKKIKSDLNRFVKTFYNEESDFIESLKKTYNNFLKKDFSKYISIESDGIYELQAFFILKGGMDDLNREFWIAEDKEAELISKMLSIYSFAIKTNEFEKLIEKANKFLKEMKKDKDTDYWKPYQYYKIENIKQNYCSDFFSYFLQILHRCIFPLFLKKVLMSLRTMYLMIKF